MAVSTLHQSGCLLALPCLVMNVFSNDAFLSVLECTMVMVKKSLHLSRSLAVCHVMLWKSLNPSESHCLCCSSSSVSLHIHTTCYHLSRSGLLLYPLIQTFQTQWPLLLLLSWIMAILWDDQSSIDKRVRKRESTAAYSNSLMCWLNYSPWLKLRSSKYTHLT